MKKGFSGSFIACGYRFPFACFLILACNNLVQIWQAGKEEEEYAPHLEQLSCILTSNLTDLRIHFSSEPFISIPITSS